MLSYSKEWDARPVRYGANQGPRDHSVGTLGSAEPTVWCEAEQREVISVEFVSGRTVEVSYDHLWITQRRTGRQAWEWKRAHELCIGDRVPFPLTADRFGGEGDAVDGYFVGAMLGDGGMTSCTPEFHGDPYDGAVAFMRQFAAQHGCGVREIAQGSIVRMRFPYKRGYRNPITELLRSYDVWGQRCESKHLPERAFSRSFWTGCLAGLIDTDGCVRERRNQDGTLHGSMEFATVSRRLATQVSDMLLRLGVANRVREVVRSNKARMLNGYVVVSRPLMLVEVARATALVRLAEVLALRIGYKAARLHRLVDTVGHVAPARSEMHGYDEAVALDRIKSLTPAGAKPVFGATVTPSQLIIVNGIVVGASG